jgi:hypothetical protein
VNVPQWVWANDPERLPDDDHARCIAAPGERILARGAHPFALTTRACLHLSDSHAGCSTASFATLQMEYRGRDWARGLAQKSWGSERFDSGSLGGEAQQAAGLALLATLEGALAAGSTVVHRKSAAPVHVKARVVLRAAETDRGPRPGHAPRRPLPALLPLTVGRGGASGRSA